MKEAVAVIPARLGSKRIPLKNIREFNGRPIIEFAIEAALNSGVFEDVIVSTDSEEIARVASNAGATIPFIRPEFLAGDDVRADAVLGHAASWVLDEYGITNICNILPTTPGLLPTDLSESFEKWMEVKDKFLTLFAVVEYQNTAFRSFLLDSTGKLEALFPEMLQKQTQDLAPTYADAGHFYWATAETWQKTTSITAEVSQGWPLPQFRTVDINVERDWQLAEALLRH